jgi:hypothetical protein
MRITHDSHQVAAVERHRKGGRRKRRRTTVKMNLL